MCDLDIDQPRIEIQVPCAPGFRYSEELNEAQMLIWQQARKQLVEGIKTFINKLSKEPMSSGGKIHCTDWRDEADELEKDSCDVASIFSMDANNGERDWEINFFGEGKVTCGLAATLEVGLEIIWRTDTWQEGFRKMIVMLTENEETARKKAVKRFTDLNIFSITPAPASPKSS